MNTDSAAAGVAPAPVNEATERLVAVSVLGVLSVLLLPLPAAVLDALLVVSIGASVLMLLVALRLSRPLEFSAFPALLLITTLFRLGLNVASTRLILTEGSRGEAAAGRVIAAFGHFAAGGSLVVGCVVFLILMVVNFAVITKGSGRISEVAARFALDAMPGKQMAIDADLAAGLVNEAEARRRRATLEQEAEFFGAMDGASKFVRGDAVAGLVIVGINILGGLVAGVLRDHLTLAQAASTYTVLTMGDGLVTQVPALLVSMAAGLVVTRTGDRAPLGTQVGAQVLGQQPVLQAAGAVLIGLGLLPGMPLLVFAALGAAVLGLARHAGTRRGEARAVAAGLPNERQRRDGDEKVEDLLRLEALEVQVGPGLLGLLDTDKGGELPGRIAALRRQVAQDLGFVMPAVHLRDNLGLDAHAYVVVLRGVELGRGRAFADRLMALHPAGQAPAIDGIRETEAAFGLPCTWIPRESKAQAEAEGLAVVDPPSVVTTHLSEIVRRHAAELVGRQEVQELVALTAKAAPKLVETVLPGVVTLAEVVAVVRALLREGVSVRDFRTVLEAVADNAPRSKDIGWLTETARRRLGPQITARLKGADGVVGVMTLARRAEETLRATLVTQDGEPVLAPDVDTARRLVAALEKLASARAAAGLLPVLLAPPDLRRPLFELFHRFVPDLHVLAARELAPGASLQTVGVLDVGEAEAAGARLAR
ncbi:MAG: flagellar biosynthesis protein FlhA [Deltaproteobacteria bacterium]|nr:flagellar biosynthesis protein FlhA [Deltaproteobacteria bacterium]